MVRRAAIEIHEVIGYDEIGIAVGRELTAAAHHAHHTRLVEVFQADHLPHGVHALAEQPLSQRIGDDTD